MIATLSISFRAVKQIKNIYAKLVAPTGHMKGDQKIVLHSTELYSYVRIGDNSAGAFTRSLHHTSPMPSSVTAMIF